MFCDQVFKAVKKGRKRLSAKMIVNFIRWNKFIESGERFKINDAYHSYFARKFAEDYPKFKDVFVFRKLRNEEKGPFYDGKDFL